MPVRELEELEWAHISMIWLIWLGVLGVLQLGKKFLKNQQNLPAHTSFPCFSRFSIVEGRFASSNRLSTHIRTTRHTLGVTGCGVKTGWRFDDLKKTKKRQDWARGITMGMANPRVVKGLERLYPQEVRAFGKDCPSPSPGRSCVWSFLAVNAVRRRWGIHDEFRMVTAWSSVVPDTL
ncbi:hypothetical protein BDQ12DRAFT_710781 [Crucibulum laeve]|uniref:Uncharacterized protein n=1 Tax=Crucibulum laeve TaxID=68775 RepID=A0A5C3M8P9_9AGAR|nr:hypothetical protein BDQ12DRAFT_710781 [Crucibulum laeve]